MGLVKFAETQLKTCRTYLSRLVGAERMAKTTMCGLEKHAFRAHFSKEREHVGRTAAPALARAQHLQPTS